MKRFFFIGVYLFFIVNISAQQITGSWYGLIPITNIRITFNITQSDSSYSAIFDSPDRGTYREVPVQSISYTDSVLEIGIPDLGLVYKGKYFDENQTFKGYIFQYDVKQRLDLGREKLEKKIVSRKQDPKRPYPYYEEEITFKNEEDSVTLAGTLTYPKKEGSFPAVVLISGSGPSDRNSEGANHKLFWVLADYLSRNGIIVLRFDDRGVAESTGDFSKATSEDFAKDVLSAIKFLKSRKKVDKNKIGLIGHSEGGMIAPMVAVQLDDIAFIVLLAGPAVPGDEIIYTQNILIGRVDGEDELILERKNELYEVAFETLKGEENLEQARKDIKHKLENYNDSLSKKLIPENKLDEFIESVTSQWFKFFVSHDPAKVLERVQCPVLSLIGDKDLQVPAKLNQPVIKEALEKSGSIFTVKTLRGINHVFQQCITGSPSEYAIIEQTISPDVLREIVIWIITQTR